MRYGDHGVIAETSSKAPRPEIRDRESRLQNLCILPNIFLKCGHHF